MVQLARQEKIERSTHVVFYPWKEGGPGPRYEIATHGQKRKEGQRVGSLLNPPFSGKGKKRGKAPPLPSLALPVRPSGQGIGKTRGRPSSFVTWPRKEKRIGLVLVRRHGGRGETERIPRSSGKGRGRWALLR